MLTYEVWDINGNVVFTYDEKDTSLLKAGCTYFVHPVIRADYKDYVEIVFADGVKQNHDFSVADSSKNPDDYVVITKPTKIELILEAKIYTGAELNFSIEFLARYSQYLQIVVKCSDSLTQTNAGKYYVTVCFKDGGNGCWSNTNGVIDRTAIVYEFEIKSKEITLTTNRLDPIKYTGEEIDVTEKLKELLGEDILQYVDITYDYSENRVDVGEYSISLTIKKEFEGNVIWTGGASGTVKVDWTIEKAVLSGTWTNLGRLELISESYVGGTEGKIKFTYVDILSGEIVDSTKLVKGRRYRVTAEIIDTRNLVWAEGFVNTYEFELTVELVWLAKPTLTRDTISFTGQAITFTIADFESTYAEHIEIVTGSLTQLKAGEYKVVIRLKNEAAAWDTGSTDEVTLYFWIEKAVLSGTWREGAGTLTLSSTYKYSYDKVVEYVYTQNGVVVDKKDLVLGETYTVTATLLDTANFVWAEGMTLTQEFVYTQQVEVINGYPTLEQGVAEYTGSAIIFVIKDWEYFQQYLEIVGSLRYTNVGKYTLVLKIRDDVNAEWVDGSTREIELTIEITQLHLELNRWTASGTVEFMENGYTGSYDRVVKYIYTDSAGNEVTASELKVGQTYTATLVLIDTENFVLDGDPSIWTYTFTFEAPAQGGLAWWVFLLIGVVLLLLIVMVIFIILVLIRRRNSENEDGAVTAPDNGYDDGAYDDIDEGTYGGYEGGDEGYTVPDEDYGGYEGGDDGFTADDADTDGYDEAGADTDAADGNEFESGDDDTFV